MSAKLKLVGWKEMAALLKPKAFEGRLHAEIERAMKRNVLLGEAQIRRDINDKKFEPNRPLTVALKGHSTPLHGEPPSELVKSITSDVPHWTRGLIGVLRNRRVAGSKSDLFNIALVVHEGATIRVTPKMRKWFAAQGHPLKPTTVALRIPPRRFLESAVSPALMAQYQENYRAAVQAALTPGLAP